MTPEEEKQFERIAQDAMSQAEQVKCDMQTFYDGLKLIGEQVYGRHAVGERDRGRRAAWIAAVATVADSLAGSDGPRIRDRREIGADEGCDVG